MATGTGYQPSHINELESSKLQFYATGVKGTCPAGTTTSVDFLLTDDVLILGGMRITNGAAFGDFMNMQVVDVDGVFAPAGTVLDQFISNWYVSSGDSEGEIESVCPKKAPAGIYLRVIYTSTGPTDVGFAVNYLMYKVLE